jgi:single-strand DNA-binding protein
LAGSVNKVILVGNLGKDPEIRRTQDGRPIGNLSLATSQTWKDKQSGERREKTEWHRVVIFNEGLCKVAEQYLKKGAKVYIEGQLATRKWTDDKSIERYSTEVVIQAYNGVLTMLDSRKDGGGGGADDDYQQQTDTSRNAYAEAHGKPADGPGRAQRASGFSQQNKNYDMDDDIPF